MGRRKDATSKIVTAARAPLRDEGRLGVGCGRRVGFGGVACRVRRVLGRRDGQRAEAAPLDKRGCSAAEQRRRARLERRGRGRERRLDRRLLRRADHAREPAAYLAAALDCDAQRAELIERVRNAPVAPVAKPQPHRVVCGLAVMAAAAARRAGCRDARTQPRALLKQCRKQRDLRESSGRGDSDSTSLKHGTHEQVTLSYGGA